MPLAKLLKSSYLISMVITKNLEHRAYHTLAQCDATDLITMRRLKLGRFVLQTKFYLTWAGPFTRFYIWWMMVISGREPLIRLKCFLQNCLSPLAMFQRAPITKWYCFCHQKLWTRDLPLELVLCLLVNGCILHK